MDIILLGFFLFVFGFVWTSDLDISCSQLLLLKKCALDFNDVKYCELLQFLWNFK